MDERFYSADDMIFATEHGFREGVIDTLAFLVRDGLLTVEAAAERAERYDVSRESFLETMKSKAWGKDFLSYRGYHAITVWYRKENMLEGNVVGFKDLLRVVGRTEEELQQNFKNCIDDYIELQKKYMSKNRE